MRGNHKYLFVAFAALVVFGLFLYMAGGVAGSPSLPAMEPVAEAKALRQAPSTDYQGPFGFGRDATEAEIAAWDIDVRPDGTGLPPGSGTVARGAEIFQEKCTECHGPDGKGGPYAAGRLGAGLIVTEDPDAPWPQYPLTIGGFWPYATILYDYINRAQPYNAPGSLESDEIYSVVAWLLHQNGLIEEDAVMNAETLPKIEMPARNRFIPFDVRDANPYQ